MIKNFLLKLKPQQSLQSLPQKKVSKSLPHIHTAVVMGRPYTLCYFGARNITDCTLQVQKTDCGASCIFSTEFSSSVTKARACSLLPPAELPATALQADPQSHQASAGRALWVSMLSGTRAQEVYTPNTTPCKLPILITPFIRENNSSFLL